MSRKTSEAKKTAKYIRPPNTLKLKVGGGGIPDDRIEKAQVAANELEIDFRPIGEGLIAEFSSALKTVEAALKQNQPFERNSLIFPVMQLKANGGMFQFRLISDVADICLQFMETVPDFNADTLEIVRAHEHAVKTIIKNELRGDGGEDGFKLVQELHKACKRYFKKYKIG